MSELETVNPKCPNCGAMITLTVAAHTMSYGVKCQYCGTRVRLKRSAPAQPAPRAPTAQPPQPAEWQVYAARGGSKGVWIAVAAAAVLLVGGGVMAFLVLAGSDASSVQPPAQAVAPAESPPPSPPRVAPPDPTPAPSSPAVAAAPAPAARAHALHVRRAKVQGPLDRAVAWRIIKRHRSSLRRCFNKARGAATGRLDLQLALSKTGTVKAAETVSSTVKAPRLERCLRRAASSWRFPVSRRGMVLITVPIELGGR